ncbi:S8 family serine peptidase [Conexibacter sp. CPCC 206217]|uniref:S8 family serine peptidase n=1 Tax=Conexibacter sp. CPCC 206217 TaxID=3064574 RepID=UPI002717829E|nr:S8 family serine peptidase [Conexibacter sp. CPCC 206217]MDO8209534.1 S8 family serine peptidase [Conexibacter sp. CPCC 206217]
MTRRRLLTTGLLAACAAAAALPSFASAAAPTDPQAAAQQPLQLMHVGEALDLIARPLADVPVMVADTGLEWNNPDIAPRLWRTPVDSQVADPDNDTTRDVPAGSIGWDFIGGANPGRSTRPDRDPADPDGQSGHGTAVAGVLGAAWNNGQGGAGVAPNARFLAARTCWDGDLCFEHIQGAAIDWAAGLGVRVVSFSWLSGPLDADSPLRTAIVDHPNVLFVTIPSGNGGAEDADPQDPQPCNLGVGNVICVSTSSPTDGLDCGAFGARSVDVAVPTQNNFTTRNGFTLGGPVSQGPTGCATSWAAPTAAGIATILFGIDPSATPADVRSAIVDSARPAAAWQGRSVSGGIADAAAAVSLFQQRRGIAPATPPARVPAPVTPAPTPRTPPTIPPRSTRDTTPPQLKVVRRGLSLKVTPSERATLTVRIERAQPGRRSRGACRRPSPRLRRAPRCTRWERVTSVSQSGVPAGSARTLRLPLAAGRRRPLARGSYRGVLVATDAAGNSSKPRTFAYEIRR